ncbi:MAG: hypothetical protein D6778_09010, partial [Nitrospirae bacterium]
WQAALVQAQIYAMNFITQCQALSVENKGCDFIDCTGGIAEFDAFTSTACLGIALIEPKTLLIVQLFNEAKLTNLVR